MVKQVTLADVARESNVSLSTASLVLRDKPGIPPETRQRVLDAARTLRYKSNNTPLPNALHKRSGRLHTVGLIIKADSGLVPHANPFYSYVMAGIEDACRRRHINLLYSTVLVDEHNLVIDTPRLLLEKSADGLLLVGAFVDETLFALLGAGALGAAAPVVLVDAYANRNQYDAVVSDNVRGAYQAVQYLVEKGHRHIALIGAGQGAYPSLRERREGYLQALRDNGITDVYRADCEPKSEEPAQAATSLLREHPQITALFGCNDQVAITAMRAAQAMGRNIPNDLSIVGFDDIDLARVVTPTLTTMHIDKIAMGRIAVQMLGTRVEFPEAERVTSVISPRLIERESVSTPLERAP